MKYNISFVFLFIFVFMFWFFGNKWKEMPFLVFDFFYLNKKNKNKVLEETSKRQKETWYHSQLYFYL